MGLVGNVLKVALSRPILLMVAKVYIPVLFPLTFLIALIATATDSAMGFNGLLPDDMRLPAAALSFIIGAALWLWTYEQLVTHGKGSPYPVAGRTLQLVTSGIYAYSRNPSVFGKLLGVLAVGFALNSVAFCCILVSALLAGSLIEKVWRQEPQLIEIFGEDYVRYRDRVPLFLPWGIIFPSRKFQE